MLLAGELLLLLSMGVIAARFLREVLLLAATPVSRCC